MKIVYERPKTLEKVVNHYCPGCHHGILHALIAEVLDEMNLADKTVGVAPVGCAVMAYNYLDIDWIEAPHGRAVAIATGIKLAHPDILVFTYQGDGDAASIGLAETLYGAIRGINVTTFMYNNAIYGMTGGQMAPTTLIGMKTTTSPLFEQSVRLGNGNIGKESPEEQLLQMQEAFSHTISKRKPKKGRSFIPKTVKYVGRNLLRRY